MSVGRRRFSLALIACGSAIVLAATAVSGSASTAQAKKIRIGLVLPALSNPFIAPIRDGSATSKCSPPGRISRQSS
jgi:ABC-type sugar transport system substrate-binding protein